MGDDARSVYVASFLKEVNESFLKEGLAFSDTAVLLWESASCGHCLESLEEGDFTHLSPEPRGGVFMGPLSICEADLCPGAEVLTLASEILFTFLLILLDVSFCALPGYFAG